MRCPAASVDWVGVGQGGAVFIGTGRGLGGGLGGLGGLGGRFSLFGHRRHLLRSMAASTASTFLLRPIPPFIFSSLAACRVVGLLCSVVVCFCSCFCFLFSAHSLSAGPYDLSPSSKTHLGPDAGHDFGWHHRLQIAATQWWIMATAFSPGSTATACTAAGLTSAGRPIDIERICASFDYAQHPRVSRVGNRVEITTTPKFGDLTQYGVSEENEKRVWAAEVRRLAAAVTDAGVTQLEGPAEWYGGDADANGYSCLHDLAHSFQMALEICTHDDLIVASKSHPQQDYSHPIALSYNRLERNFDDKIQRRKFEHLGRGGNRAFHAFVNYVTATVAIVLLRAAADDDDLWADNCLASLAQFASKMKVVGYDLPITTAISMAVFLRSQPLLSPIKLTHAMDMDPPDAEYVAPLIAFNQTVQQLLRDATATLLWDATTGQPSDMFETSAVIYDTGFHGARRQLCQERNRRIGSAAGTSTVQSASVVFDVCRAIWSDIPDDDRPVPCRTYVNWSWTSDKGGKGTSKTGAATRRRSLTNMKDVISVLVPYTMFCGPFPSTLAALVLDAFAQQPPIGACPEPSTHLASVRIRTSQYAWAETQMQVQYENHGPPHKNVYDTALAQERALARAEEDSLIDDDIRQRRHREMNERLREATTQMAGWTIGPHSITVSDNWYCRTTCTAISLLVLGALALISVAGGQPLAGGVDRPNLVVLVWTAAGFLMAYVKSTRVEAWPWHDFLRGQVVCRSISEIHAVTKINPQTLLAVLLWHADSMAQRLRTSGPFCSLFGEHEAGGFDIDIAPLNDTAMAGGHLFVVVSTHDGPALVDLVAQADDETYTAVPNAGSNTTSAHLRDALYCINAGSPDHFLTFIREKDETGSMKTKKMFLPMYRLSDNGVLEWNRVLGVLDERAIFR